MDGTARPEPLSIKALTPSGKPDNPDAIELMEDRFGQWSFRLLVKGARIESPHKWPSQEAALTAAQEHYQTF